MSPSESNERISKMIDVIMNVSRGDYSARIELSGKNDPLDALGLGVNMVIDDLRENLDTLEQRVQLRTKELEEKINTVTMQSKAITELSTPVIQVWDQILVLPLVGTVDTKRAQMVIENLLNAIVDTQALVAIMDITGVSLVDTSVAQHLLKTIEAAKMLGTDVILTGVSPYNAQTLVVLGVSMNRVVTKLTLHEGLKLAFELTENRVVKAG